ncbi:MAG: hypothetical protein JOZ91_01720 [Candidatus Eremiobacteraeota bacterium]|nr:hypothetical protein [Candidatus Eremiobacteraeota bacterium]
MFEYNGCTMMMNPGKARTTAARRAEAQALVAFVQCGPGKGLAGIRLTGATGSTTGEYFVPFVVRAGASDQEYVYAGLTAAVERLRTAQIERVLIIVDDQQLVDELERKVEPSRELFLQYVILGCKLNEFRRAKVVAATSSRLEQLRSKTESLAATIYDAPLLAHAI